MQGLHLSYWGSKMLQARVVALKKRPSRPKNMLRNSTIPTNSTTFWGQKSQKAHYTLYTSIHAIKLYLFQSLSDPLILFFGGTYQWLPSSVPALIVARWHPTHKSMSRPAGPWKHGCLKAEMTGFLHWFKKTKKNKNPGIEEQLQKKFDSIFVGTFGLEL